MVPLLLFLILLVLSWPIWVAVIAFSPPLFFGLLVAVLGCIAVFAPVAYRDVKGLKQSDNRRIGYFGTPDQWKVPPTDDLKED